MTTAEIIPIPDLSESELVERLSALVAAGGSPRRATKRLKGQGITVTEAQLTSLRDGHNGMYLTLAAERSSAQEEAIAQQLRELVDSANRLNASLIEKIVEDLEAGILPKDIERTVTAMAKVAQVGTDKLLSITGRPVSGASADPMESARELVRLGILAPVTRPSDVDTTADEEEPDAV